MQSEADQVSIGGKKLKVDRRRRASPKHTLEYIAIDNLSPFEINGSKRRKLSSSFEKIVSGDSEPNTPTLPFEITNNSEGEEDLDMYDEAGPAGCLEFCIKNFSELLTKHENEDIRLVSPKAAIIRCLPWRVLAFFRVCGEETRTVGFFLQCNAEADNSGWSCHARADLTIVAQKPGAESITKSIDHVFSQKENDWGFSNFLNWNEFIDPERGLIVPLTDSEKEDKSSLSPKKESMDCSEFIFKPGCRPRSSSLSESSFSQSRVQLTRFSSHPASPLRDDPSSSKKKKSPDPYEPFERDCVLLRIKVYADAPHGSNWDSKKFTGFVGLRNQGATCYMNSLLQALFFTNELRRAVYLMPTESEESATSIPLALQRLFFELQFNERPVNTKRLTRSFGWQSVESLFQHDVQELCRLLLDNMENKMKGTSVEGTIPSLFRGKMLSYIRCKHVPYESKREETFYDIQLKVKGNRDVYQAFQEYTTVETLSGENKYDAGEYGLQEAEKGVIFTNFPPVLYLQLMRFQYDCLANANVKVNDRFEFPYRLKLDRFLQTPDPSNPSTYILHAVLVHSGDNHSGHYVVYINPSGNNRWYKFDDDVVSRSAPREAIEQNYGTLTDEHGNVFRSCSSAYMLVYIRESSLLQVLQPISLADIPESLVSRLREERRVEADHRKVKAELNNYTSLVLVLDEDFYGWQGFDLCNFESIPSRRFLVLKRSTLSDIVTSVASILRIDASFIRLWRVITRRSGTVRFSPLLQQPKSPVQKPLSSVSPAEDPISALSALTESYQHQSKSLSKAAHLAPNSGDGHDSPILFSNSNTTPLWVQILPQPSTMPFCPLTEVLCFLKYYCPPPSTMFTTSPLLENLQIGTLTYVGWISVPLFVPLSAIFPELCLRASLPPNTPLLIYEESCMKEVRQIRSDFVNLTARESLDISDGMETVILVYQQEPTGGENESGDEVKKWDRVEPIDPLARNDTIIEVPVLPLLEVNTRLVRRKPGSRSRVTALKLVSRSKQIMRSQTFPSSKKAVKMGLFKAPRSMLKVSSTSKVSPVIKAKHPEKSVPSSYSIKDYYHELLTRVPVEFYEVCFPWHLLTDLLSPESATAIAFPIQTGDRILLPGVPLGGGIRVFKTSLLLEPVMASIRGPGFTGLISPNHTFKDLLKIVASHFSVSPSHVQIFAVSNCPTVSGERELSAIPSNSEWKVKDIMQHSLSPSRQKGNHTQPGKHYGAALQLFCQHLTISTEQLEQMCQLRCVFVDTKKMREVIRLLLIVPKIWTVSQVLRLARKELSTLGLLSEISKGVSDATIGFSQKIPSLRMFETLNSWIIQQYAPEELAGRLQLLENRLLRIEVMSPEEQSYFAYLEASIDPLVPLSINEESTGSSNINLPHNRQIVGNIFRPSPGDSTKVFSTSSVDSSSAAASMATPPKQEEATDDDDYDVNIDDDEDDDDDEIEDEEDDIEIPRGNFVRSGGEESVQEVDGEGEEVSSTSGSVVGPNNLSLICNADEEEEEEEEDSALKFLEQDSEEENDVQAVHLVGSENASERVSLGAEDDTMDSCEANNDSSSSMNMDISPSHFNSLADNTRDNFERNDEGDEGSSSSKKHETPKLPVVCSLFYQDSTNGAITTGLMPFTILLRHNERISSLLKRIRNHLGIRPEVMEKWRLAVLKGPISPSAVNMSPLAPTQESLMNMRASYKHLPMGTSEDGGEARIDLAAFMPAPCLARCGVRKSRLLFGLRPWLGIEMPLMAHKGAVAFSQLASSLVASQQHNPVLGGAVKRKHNPASAVTVAKYLPSEKPIRIWN